MKIQLSVRELVEFVLRNGDLDNRFFNNIRGVEGTRAHRKVQGKYDSRVYQKEVYLNHSVKLERKTQKDVQQQKGNEKSLELQIEGRADGIIRKDKSVIIDEIKSTRIPLEEIDEDYNPLHWAQALCYAYFLACDEDLKEVNVQLTYYHLDEDQSIKFLREYDFEELVDFFDDLIKKYKFWAFLEQDWQTERDRSIDGLDFPYSEYRSGQRKMAVAVYKSILEEKNLFIEAPTGIGKTISTIFPAVKTLCEERADKIYYLTARTIARQAAEKAASDMREQGLKLKSTILTAKDKICFMDERDCNPEVCKFAAGHFDRINDVLKEMLTAEDGYNRELIIEYSRKHRVCPFELSLELCRWSDCVICDYNYFFDPVVSLSGFSSGESKQSIILVDEAHNLVNRSREIYSAVLRKKSLEILMDKFSGRKKLSGYLGQAVNWIKTSCEKNEQMVTKDEPADLYPLLQAVREHLQEYLSDREAGSFPSKNQSVVGTNEISDEMIIDIYFEIFHFLKTADYYDDNYRTIFKKLKANNTGTAQPNVDSNDKKGEKADELDLELTLYCLDPAPVLQEFLTSVKSTIFFSATLTPLSYYKNVLGGSSGDYQLCLGSPFPHENRLILNYTGISTRFKDREKNLEKLAGILKKVVLLQPGNYLMFFPSYQYLYNTLSYFELPSSFTVIAQEKSMTERKREEFLSNFRKGEKNIVGFTVMSGIFSEGIDLEGDNLIGSIVIGPAHPTLTLERNLINNYYQEKNCRGYEYAYLYPGLNRVMQAAGRTIRTEKDRGIILLVGQRFNSHNYYQLLPSDFQKSIKVNSKEKLTEELLNFWS